MISYEARLVDISYLSVYLFHYVKYEYVMLLKRLQTWSDFHFSD